MSVSYLWIGIVVSLVLWTIWKFFIWRDIPERILEEEERLAKEKQLHKQTKQEVKSYAPLRNGSVIVVALNNGI